MQEASGIDKIRTLVWSDHRGSVLILITIGDRYEHPWALVLEHLPPRPIHHDAEDLHQDNRSSQATMPRISTRASRIKPHQALTIGYRCVDGMEELTGDEVLAP